MTDTIRWGIIGTGRIASDFTADLALLDDATVVAVGSRQQQTADDFADRFGIPHRHPSYDALAADPDVDAVYVSTPHPGHHAAARLAIEAAKAVLVEKPFTLNASQAEDLVTAARAKPTFLMEAMWTRFLPHMRRIRELLTSGVLGDIRTVTADHGQRFLPPDPTSRLYDPALGGGALLDLGIYPVSFASYVLGTPERVTAVSDPTTTGVDAQTSIVLQHAGGKHAVLTTTLGAETANVATIVGTEGRIEIDRTWYQPTSFTLTLRSGRTERFAEPPIGHGLRYEAVEVGRCLRGRRLESSHMSLDETLKIMTTLDEVRRQIGLGYPGE
jgi:predicted dehydrogenase